MSTEGIEAPRKSTNAGIRVHTGGPSEFDLLIDTMKQEIKEAVLVAMVDDPRPLASIFLTARRVMDSPTDLRHQAVVTLTVEFREKDRPNG